MNAPKNKILRQNKHFFVAMLSQTPVSVWMHGELLEYGGIIQMVDPVRVKIDDMYYMRGVCEFRIR